MNRTLTQQIDNLIKSKIPDHNHDQRSALRCVKESELFEFLKDQFDGIINTPFEQKESLIEFIIRSHRWYLKNYHPEIDLVEIEKTISKLRSLLSKTLQVNPIPNQKIHSK